MIKDDKVYLHDGVGLYVLYGKNEYDDIITNSRKQWTLIIERGRYQYQYLSNIYQRQQLEIYLRAVYI